MLPGDNHWMDQRSQQVADTFDRLTGFNVTQMHMKVLQALVYTALEDAMHKTNRSSMTASHARPDASRDSR